MKVGDEFGPGDILAAIETDKATIDFEMQEEGYLAQVLYSEGSKDIPVGTTIAIVVEEEGDVAAFKDFKAEDAGAAEPASAKADAAAPAAAPAQAQ